nr:hypothetical protein [Escherichia coli]
MLASLIQTSCSAETSYFEKHLSEFLPWGKNWCPGSERRG